MTDADVPQERIEEAANQIEHFLSRGLKIRKVEQVPADLVTERTRIGFDADRERDKYQVYYRIETARPSKIEVLETVSDVQNHIRDQLVAMERGNSSAPDTQIVETDIPPRHLDKSYVFYARSTM